MKDPDQVSIVKPRFASIPEWVIRHPGISDSPTALIVYAHLHLLGDFKTRVTTSDWREVVEDTGYSKATVMRAMKVLREAGAVVRRGSDLVLPMDGPGLIFETDRSQIRDKTVSDVRLAPLSTEVSEKVGDESPTPEIGSLNALLASRYAAFAGTPPANHQTVRWAKDMRLLLERGPTTWAKPAAIPVEVVERRINGIFDHLAEPQGSSGFCWAANIRSPGALREHWDQITAVANNGHRAPASHFGGNGLGYDEEGRMIKA